MNSGCFRLAGFGAVLGAAGVMLAAAGAHAGGAELAATAANFLLLHAAALLGIAGLAGAAPVLARNFLVCGAVLGVAAALFSADLATRAFAGSRLAPFAAPVGGGLMILGWLGLAVVCGLAAIRARTVDARGRN